MLIVLNIENTNVETGLLSGPNKFGDIIIKRGFQFEILGLSMKPWYFNSEKKISSEVSKASWLTTLLHP